MWTGCMTCVIWVAYGNALQHGTHLFVGVCSDADVLAYKRAPVMTMDERARVSHPLIIMLFDTYTHIHN